MQKMKVKLGGCNMGSESKRCHVSWGLPIFKKGSSSKFSYTVSTLTVVVKSFARGVKLLKRDHQQNSITAIHQQPDKINHH